MSPEIVLWIYLSSGCGLKPHRRHCFVFFSKTSQPLFSIGSTQEDLSQHDWKIVDCNVKNQIEERKKNYLKLLESYSDSTTAIIDRIDFSFNSFPIGKSFQKYHQSVKQFGSR